MHAEGLIALADALYRSSSGRGGVLRILNLHHNSVKDEGALRLADALELSATQPKHALPYAVLEIIEMSSCSVGWLGATAFARMLHKLPQLEVLDLTTSDDLAHVVHGGVAGDRARLLQNLFHQSSFTAKKSNATGLAWPGSLWRRKLSPPESTDVVR